MVTLKEVRASTEAKSCCYNCKYYHTETNELKDGTLIFNIQECRKGPPRMGPKLYASFPKVDFLCWCGAFERKEVYNG